MRLYGYEALPYLRRVRIFLAEKDVTEERIQVDMPSGAHKTSELLRRTSYGLSAVLDLEDGAVIAASLSLGILRQNDNLNDWQARVSTRPSAAA